MKTNKSVRYESVVTHEGGQAQRVNAVKELRRTLSTCLLFEDTFYESGDSIANRLGELAAKVSIQELIDETVRAKDMGLRHAPLWMAVALTSLHNGSFAIGNTIDKIIRRADELAEFIALYQKRNGKDAPLTSQTKKGLAKAFGKFNEYQFSKWDRDGEVKLRDVMFLVHPKPKAEQVALYKAIAEGSLAPADTWEVGLSAARGSEEKKAVWERLLSERKLGALALIRNLRNMNEVGVDREKVIEGLHLANLTGILPYQLISAWRSSPAYAGVLDKIIQRRLALLNKLSGTTVVVVDCSGSMETMLSARGTVSRMDAAGALAVHMAGICEDVRVFAYGTSVKEVQAVPGLGLIDVLANSGVGSSTQLARSLTAIKAGVGSVDRIVVITDEQSADSGIPEFGANQYIINVAPYKYGVAVSKKWIKIDGFSSAVVDWIAQEEQEGLWKDG